MVLWVLFYHQVKTNGGNAIKLFSQIILNVRCQPLDFTVTSIYYIFCQKTGVMFNGPKAQTV
jgi:hypothetical protein